MTDEDLSEITEFLAPITRDLWKIGAMLSYLPSAAALATFSEIDANWNHRSGYGKWKFGVHTWGQRRQAMVARGDDSDK